MQAGVFHITGFQIHGRRVDKQVLQLNGVFVAEVLSCGKTCEAESDHQWLGVSLSRQPGDNGGHVLVT